MKKVILALLFSVATFSLNAQTADNNVPAAKSEQENPNGPKFKFANGTVHDFGEVKELPEGIQYVFEFTNVGKEPLIVQNAQPSCSCTVPDWTKEPILPGKKGKVTVLYKAGGHPGPFIKSVFLTTNVSTAKEELIIKGTVIAANQQEKSK